MHSKEEAMPLGLRTLHGRWISLMLPSGRKVSFRTADSLHRFLIKWIVLLILSGTQHSQRYTWFSEQMFVLQMEEDSCAVAGQ